MTLPTNASIGVADGRTLTLRGKISGSGGLTKVGLGILTLNNGSNDYAGDTVISAGRLQLRDVDDGNGVIPHGPDKGNVIVEADGTLELVGGSQKINGLSGTGIIDMDNAPKSFFLTVGLNNQTSTFNGTIRNTRGILGLTKQGTGTLTLTGTGDNTYTGVTNVAQGTLIPAKATAWKHHRRHDRRSAERRCDCRTD